jgi:hypothetical protein
VKTVKVFVEGGGDCEELRNQCRQAFTTFLSKAGLAGHMPRIVPCGSRNSAFEQYLTAKLYDQTALLLVDSEGPVLLDKSDPNFDINDIRSYRPWFHMQNRKNVAGEKVDNWNKPINAKEEDLHFMVQQMETWLLTDVNALKRFYGKQFNENQLPNQIRIEDMPRKERNNAIFA